MSCDYGEFEPVAHHDHGYVFDSEIVLDEFCMAWEAEPFIGHGFLVDRSGDEHVDFAFLKLFHCHFEGLDGAFGRLRRSLSRLGKGVFRQAVHDIDSFGVGFGCAVDGVGVHLLHFRNSLSVESEKF